MVSGSAAPSRRVLEPIERISEVLFGLIMALTFTGTLSAVGYGRSEVRTMLVGALGCNLAWGLVDAIMYLMGCLADRATDRRTLAAVTRARTAEEARAAIVDHLPSTVASVLTLADLDRIHAALSAVAIPKRPVGLTREDWLGAIAVFLLVFAATVPIVVPFLIVHDALTALRVSNAVAIAMMLFAGYAYGRLTGYRPWLTAGLMVMLGCVLVALTIALGG
jgi:hypothetical protein